nr:hypothetical protein [Tanacetum cinerariifolium]
IWGLETFSNSIHWWRKDADVISRVVAWSNRIKLKKSNYDSLFYSQNSTFHKLTPSDIEMNELWFHTRVRTEFRHEVHVRTEVHRFVDKEEVSTRAVDEEDVRPRDVLEKIAKAQEQKTVDMQHCLLSLEQIMNAKNTRPSDVDQSVDHLDKNGSENVPVGDLDHQSMEVVSHCMNVDYLDKNWNDEFESVAIDGLISLWSQDADHISKMWINLLCVVKDADETDVKTIVDMSFCV